MASRADPRVDPLLSPWLAQGRSHRRGRGRCPHRPEEPRLCRDRGDPAAERSLCGGRRRDPLRDLRNQPADLDRAELGTGGRGRERRRGRRDHGDPGCRLLRGPDHLVVSGALYLVLAVLKMGWIAQFLSRAVVTGFLFGRAIDVVIGELPKLTGTEVTGSNPLQELWSWLGTLGDAQLATVLVGGAALVVVFGLRHRATGPRSARPGRRGARGVVALRSRMPAVSPSLARCPRASRRSSCPRAAGGSSQHGRARGGGARAHRVLPDRRRRQGVRGQHRYRIDINQESVAQGMANVGAGLFQGMPVSTSLSASSLNDHIGRAYRPGLAHLRCDRPPHPAGAGAAVLRPAQRRCSRP